MSCAKSVQETRVAAAAPRPKPVSAPRTAVAENIQRQVRNAVDAGEGDVRVRTLRKQLATNPGDLAARLELARLYVKSGFPDVALEHYRFAASQFPDSAEVAVAMGRTLHSLGLTADARAHLHAFVTAHPDSGWEPLSWLAIYQDRTRDYVAAETNHRTALKLKPGSDALHNNLGYNLLLQGKAAEAAVEFRRALEIAPQSLLARSNLAIALAGQPSAAVAQFQTVTDSATAHNNLAAVMIERGDYKGARRELELALGYRKDHPAVLSNLQLVSDLDGGAIDLTTGEVRSPWQRFLRTLGVVFFGPPEPARAQEEPVRPVASGDAAVRAAGQQ
jgi:Flp pilus assembly protein TadD